jgi:Cu-Zn family superoxide dismutase
MIAFFNQGKGRITMKKIIATSVIAMAFVACAHKPPPPPPEVAPAKPPTVPMKAQAVLKAAKGSKVSGTITFVEEGGKTTVYSTVENLKKGAHGFHIHETGDCTDAAAGFKKAGGHFNPTQHVHADVIVTPRHVGDLGNLVADKKNKANTSVTVEGLPLGGPESIIGKAVIIHKNKDDGKTQPTGNSGDRLACAVIESMPSAEQTPGPTETPK